MLLSLALPVLLSELGGGWTAVARSGFSAEGVPSLVGKVALVTGASTGIGEMFDRTFDRMFGNMFDRMFGRMFDGMFDRV